MQLYKVVLVTCLVQSLAAVVKRGFLRESTLAKSQSHAMQALYPYYHTSDAIHDELVGLASRCPVMKLETRKAEDRDIDVVTIKGNGAEPVNRNFLLFGEHARELISPESGLHFIKTLCGETGNKERVATILKDNEFQLVVNGNPGSRKKVEQGDFCLRVNPDGVDLNRNWDEEWSSDNPFGGADTNPGPSAFSEPETELFKELVSNYNPTNFLTVHSGTKGMYMPWAYDMHHLAKRNQPQMLKILREVDQEHCDCPFGAAGKEVGYSCPGTCLDWVYDKLQTPYAFAFEIYTDPEQNADLKARFDEKIANGMGAFYQKSSTLAHDNFKELFTEKPSDFVQLKSETHRTNRMSPEWCFANFNPDTKERFDATVENWSSAYLDVAEKVAFNLKHSEKATGAVKPDPTLGLTAESVDSSSQLPVQVDHSSALDTYMGVTKTSSSLSELDKMNNLFK
jgi:hypothetical protein